jgi:ribosomal-protein-alanine N-acetyltransferase
VDSVLQFAAGLPQPAAPSTPASSTPVAAFFSTGAPKGNRALRKERQASKQATQENSAKEAAGPLQPSAAPLSSASASVTIDRPPVAAGPSSLATVLPHNSLSPPVSFPGPCSSDCVVPADGIRVSATIRVRLWELSDAPRIVPLANDRAVSMQLRDAFPYPYSLRDAESFIQMARGMRPQTYFAVEVDGSACGGIGWSLHPDIERVSAEVGYWLGRPFWGRGIMPEVLSCLAPLVIRGHRLTRLYAVPLLRNKASGRVLEKAGFRLEGVMRRSAIKEGEVLDQAMYALNDQDLLRSGEEKIASQGRADS